MFFDVPIIWLLYIFYGKMSKYLTDFLNWFVHFVLFIGIGLYIMAINSLSDVYFPVWLVELQHLLQAI